MGAEIPGSIFDDLEGTVPLRNTFGCEKSQGWTPAGAMKWYDSIIDDLLANPGTDLTDCAHRLGRSPDTVQAIARSDMFKARWAQRRQQYEELLNQKLVAKLTQTADLALDCTIEVLKKKRDAVPLPILAELTKTALDRLGYAPQGREAGSQVHVTLQQNNVVSAEALAAAREKLKLVESVAHGPPDGREATGREHVVSDPKDPVAGQEPTDGEEVD